MNSRLSVKHVSGAQGATDLLICMAWATMLMDLFVAVCLRIPILVDLAPVIVPILFIIVTVFASRVFFGKIHGSDYVFYVVCIIVFLLNYTFYTQNNTVLERFWYRFLVAGLLMYFVGLNIDINRYFKPFFYISVVCVLYATFRALFYEQQLEGTMEDREMREAMSTAYVVLPHVLFIIYATLQKFSLTRLLMSVLGVVLMLSYGTRGSAVCLVLFIAIYLLLLKDYRHKIVVWIGIGVIAIALYIYMTPILIFMQALMQDLGMSSRIFDKVLIEEFGSSTDRDDITIRLWDALQTSPLAGYGMGGSWQFVGTYPHNFAVDMWISFGWFFGTLLILAVLGISIWAFRCGSVKERGFLLLLFVCGFLKLFMSYTYLDEPYLYMMLGVAISMIRKNRLRTGTVAVKPI